MIFQRRYGFLDRVLHRVAFRAGTAQQALADVEELLFRDRLESVSLRDPVFICALPRSGTTILLNLLWGTGRFASHTYQDMPFVLCPLIWRRFARGFSSDDAPVERAHGDGLTVSGTSPEAFEEMVWKHFWPGHYETDRIRPWGPRDRNPEFDEFFRRHLRKVILVRQDHAATGAAELRYLSKNNMNVARLGASQPILEGSRIVVPFRPPLQQAASLLRQHRRFTAIHREDPFTRRYMEAIGHHEFGETLRPVAFGNWLDRAPASSTLEFWVRYWVATYRHVLEEAGDSVALLSYAALTSRPEEALRALARAVDVPPSDLARQASEVGEPRSHEVDEAELPGSLLQEARTLERELEARSLL